MHPLRLAIVTRRFWPYCGPAELGAGEIAEAILRAGHHVEILTVRWEKNWPRKFAFREIGVTRLGRPVTGPWATFRFLRSLSRYVKEVDLDGIIVYGLQEESWAAIRNFARQLPVVVRVDQLAVTGEFRSQFSGRQLAALNSVKRVLVDSHWTSMQLAKNNAITAGLVSVVPEAVVIDPTFQRSLSRQGTSRVALSDAHPILQIEATQPLVVCGAPLNGDRGLFDLVEAWPRVLDRFPNARLWILGDGVKSRQVWERIVELNLANSVIMPGFFDDLSDIFQAADVYVHPLRSDASCGCLVRALAAGVCTVATTTMATEELITKNVSGLLTPTENPSALAEAIHLALNSNDLRERLGRAAQNIVQERSDIDKLVSAYLSPFMETSDRVIETVKH
jgi:glycosyltransferase involved in cell wall biosynthesis